MKNLWDQLRERKVVRSAIAYIVVAWLLLQVGNTLFEMLEFPSWAGRTLIALLAAGFPITVVLSWIFDISPAGISVTPASDPERKKGFEFSDPKPVDVNELDLSLPRVGELIGRREERETLRSCLEKACQGEGGIVLIGGEPGVGKTRLAEEALRIGREEGMLPFAGHAYEERGAAFITSTEILESIARSLPPEMLRNVLGPTAPELARLMPELRRIFPEIPEPLELPPDQQQRYLFNSVLECLSRLSRCGPLVFLLDDLHWADESSIALLEHIAPHTQRLPVLMVGTYRDVSADIGDAFRRALPRFSNQPWVTLIRLDRLDLEEVRALLASLGGPDPPDETVRLFVEATQGNAFFVQAVFHHLADEGQLFDADGRWATHVEQPAVPVGVRLVVQKRIQRMGDTTSELLRAAAVVGLRFTLDVIETANGRSADEILDAVEEAEAAALVVASAGGRESRYEFSHALVRQTLLDGISGPRRQRLHLRIADAMRQLYGDKGTHLAAMAMHYYEAGTAADIETTRYYLELAGRQLLGAVAADEAVTYFDLALNLGEDMEPAKRAQLLYYKGFALRNLGRWADAARDWQEALPIMETSNQNEIVARICWDLAYQCIWIGANDDAIALGHRGLKAVGEAPSAGRSRLLAILGHAYETNCDWERSELYLSQAVRMAEQLGDERLLGAEVLMSCEYQNQHWARGRPASEIADRAIELVRRAGSPWDLSTLLGVSMVAYMCNGRFDDAEALYEEGIALAERHGDIGNEIQLLMVHGAIQCFRGHFEEGQRLLQYSVDWCIENQLPWTPNQQTWLAMTHFWAGEWQSAARIIDEAVANQVPGGFLFGTERAHKMLMLAYENDDRAHQLIEDLQPLLPVAGSQNPHGRWHVGMASLEAAALLGLNETAAGLYPCAKQLIDIGSFVIWTLGSTEKLAAIAAAAGGKWDLAGRHFDSALEQAERFGYPMGAAEALFWRARMLLVAERSGDEERAADLLKQARDRFADLGMSRHEQLASGLLEHGLERYSVT